MALLGALLVYALEPVLDRRKSSRSISPVRRVAVYALSNMLDGIARSYSWTGVALLPPYIAAPV